MKIILEESDIGTIIKQHVVASNLLGLANKPFTVEVEVDDQGNVMALLDTDVVTTGSADVEPKVKRKRRSSAEVAAANEASTAKPAPVGTLTAVETVEEEPSIIEDEGEDTVEEEEIPPAAVNNKSLFG